MLPLPKKRISSACEIRYLHIFVDIHFNYNLVMKIGCNLINSIDISSWTELELIVFLIGWRLPWLKLVVCYWKFSFNKLLIPVTSQNKEYLQKRRTSQTVVVRVVHTKLPSITKTKNMKANQNAYNSRRSKSSTLIPSVFVLLTGFKPRNIDDENKWLRYFSCKPD